MTDIRHIWHRSLALPALFLAACSGVEFTHVKPGQSARVEVEVKKAPPAKVVGVPSVGPANVPSANVADLPAVPLPPPPVDIVPEPALPDPTNVGDKVADLYTRGCLAMKAGKTAEAISALEETVKFDPSFADAWTRLVILYQNSGQKEKAMKAYRRIKELGQPHGAGPEQPMSGGLGLIP